MSIAIQQFFLRLQDEERGAGLAEYALLLVLVAIASIVALTALGGTISDVFDQVEGELNTTP
jgi:pilus assembly protein Flp/PilA